MRRVPVFAVFALGAWLGSAAPATAAGIPGPPLEGGAGALEPGAFCPIDDRPQSALTSSLSAFAITVVAGAFVARRRLSER